MTFPKKSLAQYPHETNEFSIYFPAIVSHRSCDSAFRMFHLLAEAERGGYQAARSASPPCYSAPQAVIRTGIDLQFASFVAYRSARLGG